jgi:hypothetical protein
MGSIRPLEGRSGGSIPPSAVSGVTKASRFAQQIIGELSAEAPSAAFLEGARVSEVATARTALAQHVADRTLGRTTDANWTNEVEQAAQALIRQQTPSGGFAFLRTLLLVLTLGLCRLVYRRPLAQVLSGPAAGQTDVEARDVARIVLLRELQKQLSQQIPSSPPQREALDQLSGRLQEWKELVARSGSPLAKPVSDYLNRDAPDALNATLEAIVAQERAQLAPLVSRQIVRMLREPITSRSEEDEQSLALLPLLPTLDLSGSALSDVVSSLKKTPLDDLKARLAFLRSLCNELAQALSTPSQREAVASWSQEAIELLLHLRTESWLSALTHPELQNRARDELTQTWSVLTQGDPPVLNLKEQRAVAALIEEEVRRWASQTDLIPNRPLAQHLPAAVADPAPWIQDVLAQEGLKRMQTLVQGGSSEQPQWLDQLVQAWWKMTMREPAQPIPLPVDPKALRALALAAEQLGQPEVQQRLLAPATIGLSGQEQATARANVRSQLEPLRLSLQEAIRTAVTTTSSPVRLLGEPDFGLPLLDVLLSRGLLSAPDVKQVLMRWIARPGDAEAFREPLSKVSQSLQDVLRPLVEAASPRAPAQDAVPSSPRGAQSYFLNLLPKVQSAAELAAVLKQAFGVFPTSLPEGLQVAVGEQLEKILESAQLDQLDPLQPIRTLLESHPSEGYREWPVAAALYAVPFAELERQLARGLSSGKEALAMQALNIRAAEERSGDDPSRLGDLLYNPLWLPKHPIRPLKRLLLTDEGLTPLASVIVEHSWLLGRDLPSLLAELFPQQTARSRDVLALVVSRGTADTLESLRRWRSSDEDLLRNRVGALDPGTAASLLKPTDSFPSRVADALATRLSQLSREQLTEQLAKTPPAPKAAPTWREASAEEAGIGGVRRKTGRRLSSGEVLQLALRKQQPLNRPAQ